MRVLTSTLRTAVTVGLLAGCSAGNVGSSSTMPSAEVAPPSTQVGVARLSLGAPVAPAKKKSAAGLLASDYMGPSGSEGLVNEYHSPNDKDKPPTCSIPAYHLLGIGADPEGNVMVPGDWNGYYWQIRVYKGGLCGKLLGSPKDGTGQAADAASLNAATGKIVVGELTNNITGVGDIVVCTLRRCGKPITSSNIRYDGLGVAVNKNGDCWMSAYKAQSSGATLSYWPGCTGTGQTATHFVNDLPGGLFIDNEGNLGSISQSGHLYVYKGCKPSCKLVGGPFALKGGSIFGNLNASGNLLAVGDYIYEKVDVFKYAPTGVTYLYSFNNGLTGSGIYSGIFAPTNRQ